MPDIVVIAITEDNDYQRSQVAEAQETARALGLTCKVAYGETPIGQIHQIFEECLNQSDEERPKL